MSEQAMNNILSPREKRLDNKQNQTFKNHLQNNGVYSWPPAQRETLTTKLIIG